MQMLPTNQEYYGREFNKVPPAHEARTVYEATQGIE